VSVIISIVIIHLGTQYLIHKKIQADSMQQSNVGREEAMKGA